MNEIEKGQLAATTIQCFSEADGCLSNFPGLLKRVIEERVWEHRVHRGREYRLPNLHALITLKPLDGWGEDPKKIEAVIKDDPEALALFREAMTGEPHVHKPAPESDNVTITPERGNARAYTVSRLKRERPDLFDRVVNGELSANAAAIEAGWRKKPEPLEVAKKAIERLPIEEKNALLIWLEEDLARSTASK